MSTHANDRKLPMRVKLGFPVLNIASTIQMLIQMYFLLMFYTNILGISGTAAGIIVMLARIWDFINDPLMGIIVDKMKRPSKCLFIIRCATVPTAIFMVLCYAAPNLSYTMKIVWASVTFVCFGMSQTAYSIAKDSLQPKLTSSKSERAKMSVYNNVFSTILNALVPAVTMPLVNILAGQGMNTAFIKVAAIYAVVYIISGFLGSYLCRGYEYDEEISANAEPRKASDMLKALAQNKCALSVVVVQVVKMLFSSIGSSVMVYYCTYNLGDANAMSYASSISVFISLIPVLFLVPLCKKFGNAGIGMLGSGFAIAIYAIAVVSGVPSVPVFVVLYLLAGVGGSLANAAIPLCLMDAVDYGEWKSGRKDISVTMSAYGIGNKIGLAFGTSVAGFVIGALNFDPNAATQPTSVLNAFFHLTFTAQIVVYGVMFLMMFYLSRIEKKLPEMKAEVAARKTAA